MINFQRSIVPIISGVIFSQGLAVAIGLYHVDWSTTLRVLCGVGIAAFALLILILNQLSIRRTQRKEIK
jgi:hypothetical protein